MKGGGWAPPRLANSLRSWFHGERGKECEQSVGGFGGGLIGSPKFWEKKPEKTLIQSLLGGG